MPDIKHKPVNVYAITRNGNALTDTGVKTVTDMAMRQPGIPADATGALVHTGPDLLDIGNLAMLLRGDPAAQLVISHETAGLILLDRKTSSSADIETLLDDAAQHGVTSSWEALAIAAGLEHE